MDKHLSDSPILMFGPMAAACHRGAKTQTRRIPHKIPPRIGHRFWVKESFRVEALYDDIGPNDLKELNLSSIPVWYEANGDGSDDGRCAPGGGQWGKLRPSIFMPKNLSRTTLRVTARRHEHLHEITEDDALAEGISATNILNGEWRYGIGGPAGGPSGEKGAWPLDRWKSDPIDAFRVLWDELYPAEEQSWYANPLVRVVCFSVTQKNINEVSW